VFSLRTLIVMYFFCTAALCGNESSPSFANSKRIQRTCNTVWPTMLSTITKNGFAPDLSDRTGGIFKARFVRGESLYRAARNDMNAFTIKPLSRWAAVERFRVESIIATVTSTQNACSVTLRVQYAVLRNNLAENGWVALESNGRLEWMILAEIDHIATNGPASVPREDSGPHFPAQPAPFATMREDDKPKGIIVRFTSTPGGAEVQVDGEYWGSTPTSDLTRLAAGSHLVLVKKLGYLPWERKVTLAPGDNRVINSELEIAPSDPTKPRVAGVN
jgi:hypothetical protein